MGWFKRKKEEKQPEESEEVPELPELPKFPEIPRFSTEKKFPELPKSEFEISKLPEIKSLPSFPGQLGSELNERAVKSAVSLSSPEARRIERRTLEIADMESSSPIQTSTSRTPAEIIRSRKEKIYPPKMSIPTVSKKIEPVYIRIDKFKQAIKSFQEIQSKVMEIESLLGKIRETKQKEDDELREWERELETIKARIDAINKDIFSKLD